MGVILRQDIITLCSRVLLVLGNISEHVPRLLHVVWCNKVPQALETSDITDCKLDSVVYAGVCVLS